ncbi:14183_t:CDS:2, partial [Racocetra fulgida]
MLPKKKGPKSVYIYAIVATLVLVSLYIISIFDIESSFSSYDYTLSSPAKPQIQEKSEWLTNFVDPLIGIQDDVDNSKYGVISQFPFVSSLDLFDLKDYSSPRSLESFEVGFARIGLKRYDLVVELTASRRAALHRYIFPPLINESHVMIDLSRINARGKYVAGAISVTSNEMKGFGRYKDWRFGSVPEYSVYFCSQFDKNASEYYTFWNGVITSNSSFES